jgi:hypothetical protein
LSGGKESPRWRRWGGFTASGATEPKDPWRGRQLCCCSKESSSSTILASSCKDTGIPFSIKGRSDGDGGGEFKGGIPVISLSSALAVLTADCIGGDIEVAWALWLEVGTAAIIAVGQEPMSQRRGSEDAKQG